jgi:hypothetical protein
MTGTLEGHVQARSSRKVENCIGEFLLTNIDRESS